MSILKEIAFFILAGLCEITGGYLIWLYVREEKPLWVAVTGIALMALYGVVATLQPSTFGRVYATYGGVFIILSLLFSWKVDKIPPDMYDLFGTLLICVGIAVMFFGPRNV